MKTHLALVVTAPPGAGKRTISQHILATFPMVERAVSMTTRDQREGEEHGVDYYFVDKADFKRRVMDSEFIEWQEHYGNFYGALKLEAKRIWDEGKTPLFEVGVRGAELMKEQFGDDAQIIFVDTPIELVADRLREQGVTDEDHLAELIQKVSEDLVYREQFNYVLINDNTETPKTEAEAIVTGLLSEIAPAEQ